MPVYQAGSVVLSGRPHRMHPTARRLNAGGTNVPIHFHHAALGHPLYTPVKLSRLRMGREIVEIEDRMDRWRYVCPRGHRSWEPTNHHFWCQQCAAAEEVDGVFHELRDRYSGKMFEREEVQLLTEAGPYDADLDRGPA